MWFFLRVYDCVDPYSILRIVYHSPSKPEQEVCTTNLEGRHSNTLPSYSFKGESEKKKKEKRKSKKAKKEKVSTVSLHMCVYVCVCSCVCVWVCVCVCVCLCVSLRLRVCLFVRVRWCWFWNVSRQRICVRLGFLICTCAYLCLCVGVCFCVCVVGFVFVCVHERLICKMSDFIHTTEAHRMCVLQHVRHNCRSFEKCYVADHTELQNTIYVYSIMCKTPL
jgi:hypothetical protein